MSAPIVQAAGGVPGEPLFMDTSVVPLGRMGDDMDSKSLLELVFHYLVLSAGF